MFFCSKICVTLFISPVACTCVRVYLYITLYGVCSAGDWAQNHHARQVLCRLPPFFFFLSTRNRTQNFALTRQVLCCRVISLAPLPFFQNMNSQVILAEILMAADIGRTLKVVFLKGSSGDSDVYTGIKSFPVNSALSPFHLSAFSKMLLSA